MRRVLVVGVTFLSIIALHRAGVPVVRGQDPTAANQPTRVASAGVAALQFTHRVVPAQPETPQPGVAANEVAFVPKGDRGVHYQGDAPDSERLPRGPAALAVDGDGNFWILDTVSGHILEVGPSGGVIADLDKSAQLLDGHALAWAEVGAAKVPTLAVLDLGPGRPRVLQYDTTGKDVSSIELPAEWMGSVHEIALNSDGSVDIFVLSGDIGRYRLAARGGRVSTTRMTNLNRWGPNNGPVLQPVDPENRVVEKQHLGKMPQGDDLFRVGELSGDQAGNIYVDVTVQRISSRLGLLVGIARVPLREQYIPVGSNDGIAVDSRTGEVFVLVPQADGASIRKLQFVKRLSPAPPQRRPGNETPDFALQATSFPSVSTATMMGVSNNYCNKVGVPASAVPNDSTTAGRTRPSYMSTYGGSYTVPYSYGGFDDRANFAAHMSAATSSNHYKAGDVDTTQQIFYTGPGVNDYTSTSKPYFGVDCSGFVSRCWKLTSKAGTSSLTKYVAPYCPATFQQGDIMLRAGSHVRMFIDSATSPSPTGSYRYEESGGSPYGVKTIYLTLTSQYSQGYVHYRYANAIASSAVATPTTCGP